MNNSRVTFSCTFQRAVVAVLHGTDIGSYHFYCTVKETICCAVVYLSLFLLLNVVNLLINDALGLVFGMTKQESDATEVDIVNY